MNKNSIIFFHKSNSNLTKDILNTCNKMQLNMFECSSLSIMLHIKDVIKPLCIVIEEGCIDEQTFCDLAQKHKENHIFLIGDYECNEENVIFCDDTTDFENKIIHLFKRIDKNAIDEKGTIECYQFVTKQLNKLHFLPNHLGSMYIKEVVVLLYQNRYTLRCFLSKIYPFISYKYQCNSNTIERSIRFAIKKAYQNCKQLEDNDLIFKTMPTIKQFTSYLLDRFLVTQM